MILVITGTHTQGFNRLVKAMDILSSSSAEKVVIQTGSSKCVPKHAVWFRFLESDEDIHKLMVEADIVVAHAGAGTIIDILKLGKPLVLVPRRREFGEIVDDQQVELANELAKSSKAIVVNDVDLLATAIEAARKTEPKPIPGGGILMANLRHLVRRMEEESESDIRSLVSGKR